MDKSKKDILYLFEKADGLVSTSMLEEAGVSYYRLNQLLEAGEIERVRHGWYRHKDYAPIEWQEVSKIIKDGVFCLHSAAQLHELSTFVSGSYQVAIPWKRKVTLPAYPSIRLFYWKDEQYETGIIETMVSGVLVPVYDPEKTVCDFLKMRNKVGLAATKEVVKTYLTRKDRNLELLHQYARQLRLISVVRQYVDILI